VNLTNSYDKPEQNENTDKMKELGKFAKVSIPEFDEKVCISMPELLQQKYNAFRDVSYISVLLG
jgi:hypothetical protein